jgi:thiol:disulfide interchange protein
MSRKSTVRPMKSHTHTHTHTHTLSHTHIHAPRARVRAQVSETEQKHSGGMQGVHTCAAIWVLSAVVLMSVHAAPPAGTTHHAAQTEFAGLYEDDASLRILNNNTFREYLDTATVHTLVEFYASWCGHCISFAPIFRQFSLAVKRKCMHFDRVCVHLRASLCSDVCLIMHNP